MLEEMDALQDPRAKPCRLSIMNQTFAYGAQARAEGSATDQASLRQELLRLVEHSVWANLRWVEAVYSQPNPEERPRELRVT